MGQATAISRSSSSTPRPAHPQPTASPAVKTQYDGADRETKVFYSDHGNDSTWSDAGSVTGDIVLEQENFDYDADSNVKMVTTKQRFHDDTLTGELGDVNGQINGSG